MFFKTKKYLEVVSDATSTESKAFINHGRACLASNGIERTKSCVFILIFDVVLIAELDRALSGPPSHSTSVITKFSAIRLGKPMNVLDVFVDQNKKRRNFKTSEIVEVEIPSSKTTMAVRLRKRPSALDSDSKSLTPTSSNQGLVLGAVAYCAMVPYWISMYLWGDNWGLVGLGCPYLRRTLLM